MKKIFLTFFDRNYLARGIAMIDSLKGVEPSANIIVFALDNETQVLLEQIYQDSLIILPPNYVSERWPHLERLKTTRKHWEYIATRKAWLIYTVLQELENNELLYYVDSDTLFYSSPAPAFRAMLNASIGISPHAFSPKHTSLSKFGRFNAGFLIVRKDKLGLTCMRDWAADCETWCYQEVVDGKFMNQGYLTSWPSRYQRVATFTHLGLNLGPWNVDGNILSKVDGELFVNDKHLIFYHFHNWIRHEGIWKNASTMVSRDNHQYLFENVYDTYSFILFRTERRLAALGFDIDIHNRLGEAQ
jgi:hypothetical protein